jgi:predicted nucleic acid-binding protein
VTVIDSSAYLKFLIGEEGGEAVRPWLDPEHAPRSVSLLLTETGNVLWKYIRAGAIAEGQAIELYTMTADICREGVIRIEPDELYGDRALRLAIQHAHSFYDMLFVALAVETHEGLVTGDTLQAQVAKKCEIDVFLI